MAMKDTCIAFIGGGNMASAILGGLLRQGTRPDQLWVVDPSPEVATRLQAQGVRVIAQADTPLKQADLVDLKPGTPYFVRLLVINKVEQSRTFGPETVFDTKPIDCTPKKKSCIIS